VDQKQLQMRWTQGVNNPEEVEKLVRNSPAVLKRLREILDSAIQNIPEGTEEDYKSPSWSHLQADRNGYKRALKNIRKLTDHIQ